MDVLFLGVFAMEFFVFYYGGTFVFITAVLGRNKREKEFGACA
jgi:hypothetical protein